MKILVISGSPKGNNSISLHTCLYLEKHFPNLEFSYIHAGSRIRALEKDFTPALEAMRAADLLLFCYPVYTFLVPYQLHRFIELMKASGEDFSGKAATQVSTSKHFYDITAHRFIKDNCADMGMRVLDGLSADMDDILTPKGRRQASDWLSFVLWQLEGRPPLPQDHREQPRFLREAPADGVAESVAEGMPQASGVEELTAEGGTQADGASEPTAEGVLQASGASESTADGVPQASGGPAKSAVIVADIEPGDTRLQAMIDRFVKVFPHKCDVINIREFPFQGGCLSCFNCAATGKCVYKDGFDEFLRGTIHRHDAILYAFRIQDHSMGSRFKMYDDRQFCNGHRTVTMGTPFGYLVEGEYSKEENLRMLLEARAQVGGNFLAGVASDEGDVDADIDRLSATLDYAMRTAYCPPQNFLGVGGMKIFRDLIYMMRGLMRADHKFFKSHGQYDFPQKRWKDSLKMYLVGALMRNKKLRAKAGGKFTEGMIGPYRKAIEE